MRLYFLPPYNPELNRIELLRHKIKYELLPFKTFSPDELEQAIDEISQGFGLKIHANFLLLPYSTRYLVKGSLLPDPG